MGARMNERGVKIDSEERESEDLGQLDRERRGTERVGI